jgi:hypothetical protein
LKQQQAAEKAAEQAARDLDKAKRRVLKEEERASFLKDPPTAGAQLVSSWAGRPLKVVIKAANYILQPGQEYSGTWHIEGMPHERIVASAIYYYVRDASIHDAGLYLRRKRERDDFPGDEDYRYEVGSGSSFSPR